MSDTFADRFVRNRTSSGLKQWLVVGVPALIVAVSLVALGRWTAPSAQHTARASAPAVRIAHDTPATITPSVMPPRALQQTLERIFVAAPADTPGTMAPSVMPPRGLQQVLEHIYLGTPLEPGK
jgi:hypothetical protein